MPEPNPRASRACLWVSSIFLFFCFSGGAVCLVIYLTHPEKSPKILLILGYTFVCLPWFFWILTVLYRLVSRACGFRMAIGNFYNYSNRGAAADGGGGGDGGDAAAAAPVDASPPENYDGRHVQFGEATGAGDNKNGGNMKRPGSSSSSSSSRSSHESEMPLAFSMAS